jgi:hypothetical protein
MTLGNQRMLGVASGRVGEELDGNRRCVGAFDCSRGGREWIGARNVSLKRCDNRAIEYTRPTGRVV